MERILISACLMGEKVRYDGQGKKLAHPFIEKWKNEGRLVVFCPELAGGFQVPRPPAEIAAGQAGLDVLDGRARVIEFGGRDVSVGFIDGARRALEKAQSEGCRFALLIDGSPSCGSIAIYDGSFSGRKQPGKGVTAAILEEHGIKVFSPAAIEELAAELNSLSIPVRQDRI